MLKIKRTKNMNANKGKKPEKKKGRKRMKGWTRGKERLRNRQLGIRGAKSRGNFKKTTQ